MIKRKYYGLRKGLTPSELEIDLSMLKKLFLSIFTRFDNEGYFQKYFGIPCKDGEIPGELGEDIQSAIFISLRKEKIWPISENINGYSEEDLFDVIEFLHDHCAKPTRKKHHAWNNCGWHVIISDDIKGKDEFCNAINPILKNYKAGFELSKKGEILTIPEDGLMPLIETEIVTSDKENIDYRINAAISKFRKATAPDDQRRDALRDLAAVLEFLRPKAKSLLFKKDESELFNIANNFGIRHHNQQQKTDYDEPLWHSWIFYSYLSTIHLLIGLIKKREQKGD